MRIKFLARHKTTRRIVLAVLLLVAVMGVLVARPAYHWVGAWLRDKPVIETLPHGHFDDASRMQSTRVAEIWEVPADPEKAETQLRLLLKRAHTQKLRIAIAGARHSMGGHTVYPEGIVLDMLPFSELQLDADRRILRVGSGARWSVVIPFLDAKGFSPAVMQSNNDFSIGGSISVNCHGWQHNSPPIAGTVESFRLMKADGSVLRCSRTENAELFSLVLGGYGLFGIILDVDLRVVPNERYMPEIEVVAAEDSVARFAEKVNRAKDIGMVYSRLCVVPGEESFCREALLTVLRKSPCEPHEIPTLAASSLDKLRREVYRAQINSDDGKRIRWKVEKALGEQASAKYFSRNQLLNGGAIIYQEQNADRTDILHEYFIPASRLADFLTKVRQIIPRHKLDLLNVTIRNVSEDKVTFLRYADQEMFGLVMLFNQPRTPEADRQMEALTQALIDAAIVCGGRYYLCYRPHASREQFEQAYPQGIEFFERKRHYDPAELFQNQFYFKYGRN